MNEPKGEAHHSAKLTVEDVRLIRLLYSQDMQIKKIAEKFETPYGTVWDICQYRTWRHV